jgi:hypothetical protein
MCAPPRRGRYSFTLLKTPYSHWELENFGVEGVPSSFLVDQQGRIVMKPDFSTPEGRQLFGDAMDWLLGDGVKNTTQDQGE